MIPPYRGRLKVSVEARINPSEDPEKVKKAIASLFGKGMAESCKLVGKILICESDSYLCLKKIYEQIRNRRTMAVFRRLLRENRSKGETWVYLNRQAAYMGKVIACEEEQESPLGPIVVKFHVDDLDGFIEWITPYAQTRRR